VSVRVCRLRLGLQPSSLAALVAVYLDLILAAQAGLDAAQDRAGVH
jgi:hypothetical protein